MLVDSCSVALPSCFLQHFTAFHGFASTPDFTYLSSCLFRQSRSPFSPAGFPKNHMDMTYTYHICHVGLAVGKCICSLSQEKRHLPKSSGSHCPGYSNFIEPVHCIRRRGVCGVLEGTSGREGHRGYKQEVQGRCIAHTPCVPKNPDCKIMVCWLDRCNPIIG
jgi:hypothetical protein